MKLLDRITIEPGKCGGRPCIRGYRIRAEFPEGDPILATLLPCAPLACSTNFALGTPGNGRGSNAVSITRPA